MNVNGDVLPVYAEGLGNAMFTMSVIFGAALLFYVVRVSIKYIQKKKKKKKKAKKEVSFFFS